MNGVWTNPCTLRICTEQIGCHTSASGGACSSTADILGKVGCDKAADGYVLDGDKVVDKQGTCTGVGAKAGPGTCVCKVRARVDKICFPPSFRLRGSTIPIVSCTNPPFRRAHHFPRVRTCVRRIHQPNPTTNPNEHAPCKPGYGGSPTWSGSTWDTLVCTIIDSASCGGDAGVTNNVNECKCNYGYHGSPSFDETSGTWTTASCKKCDEQPTKGCKNSEAYPDTPDSTTCVATPGYTDHLECAEAEIGYYLDNKVAIKCAPQSTSACKNSASECATGSSDYPADPAWTTTRKCIGQWLGSLLPLLPMTSYCFLLLPASYDFLLLLASSARV